MELDQIMWWIGRLLIAAVLIIAVFKGVQVVVPAWFDNAVGSTLNGVVGQIPAP